MIAIGWMGCRVAPPARPAPPPPPDDLVAWAERSCACTDLACAQRVDAELAVAMPRVDAAALLVDPDLAAVAIAAKDRAIGCLHARGVVPMGFAPLAMASARAFAAQQCACRDRRCVTAVYRFRILRFQHLMSAPIGDRDRATLIAANYQGTRCREAFADPAPVPSAAEVPAP